MYSAPSSATTFESDTSYPSEFLHLRSQIHRIPFLQATAEFIELYALESQIRNGDCSLAHKPAKFDVLGNDRWESWMKLKGIDVEDAITMYIDLAERVLVNEGRMEVKI